MQTQVTLRNLLSSAFHWETSILQTPVLPPPLPITEFTEFLKITLTTASFFVCVYVEVCVCVFSRPDRLRDIADRFNLDQDAVLDNVLYARAYTSKSSLLFE